MFRAVKIILYCWKTTLIQAMEYRTSFLIGILANCADFIFGLLQYVLFFTAAESVAGWERHEMLAFYGIFMLGFSLHFIFLFPNLSETARLVNQGKLDLILTKPISSQLFLSFRLVSFDEIGSFLAAQTLLLYLWLNGSLALTASNVLQFLICMLCSLGIIYSIFIFFLSLAVYLEKLENIADLLWSFFSFCRYPVDIYPGILKVILSVLIPVAFITTVPARALLGSIDGMTIILGVSLTLVFLLFSRLCWQTALKSYTSAGG